MSTFNGFVKEINYVSIDKFEKENVENSTTFFLSHCHADHMHGLKSTEFIKCLYRQNGHHLYCSEITALILKNMREYEALKYKIKTVRICHPTLICIPQIDSDGYPQEVMLTLLPAGHCPGSTMFLFETTHERILYTGDFRISIDDVPKLKNLHHKDGTVKDLTCLYIDTTFWNQQFNIFPSRDESLQLIVDQIEQYMIEQHNGHIHIDRPARIGSEFIIIALARKFKTKIHVSSETYELYQGIYEVEMSVTRDPGASRIHMCENFRPGKHGRFLPCIPSYHPVLFIRPTAQWYACGGEFVPVKYDKAKSFVQISLSMHASRQELISVIKYLSPKKVVACVIPTNSTQEQVDGELTALLKKEYAADNFPCSSSLSQSSDFSSFVDATEEALSRKSGGFGEEIDYET